MKTLCIDLETYASVNLAKSGVYRYAASPDFEVLLFGYSVDYGPVQVIDLACGETVPAEVIDALTDDTVTKWAYNCAFERICLSRFLGLSTGDYLSPLAWKCSMVWAATLGLPLSLKSVGAVLKLDKQKLSEGKDLIKYFCQPCTPTKANGERKRNYPYHAPETWSLFKDYNLRDVDVEIAIQQTLSRCPVPERLWDEYHLDQTINDRGVALDMVLVQNAIALDDASRLELTEALKRLTDLENPNSVTQLKEWLADNGLETDTLGKKAVAALLETSPPALQDVLSLRQQLAKSSVKKYQAMQNCVCADGRVRGMFQFYGAARTGRWAGRLIQVQNLHQNHMPDLDQARDLVRGGHTDALRMLYDSVPSVLSELLRTAFIPKPRSTFIVADFSAIEARVIAWLAGETWRNDVFATHGKIYEASASQMFRVPIEEITKGSTLRQKGKLAELSIGFSGSVGALKAMGALDMGLEEEELPHIVNAWRLANPNIVKLWYAIEKAAISCVKHNTFTRVESLVFSMKHGFLFVELPSGRNLAYARPQLRLNRFGREGLTYEGVGKTKKWERIETFGGKLTENIVQAIARDLLAEAMRRLHDAGCEIVLHCHDEVVIESGHLDRLDTMTRILCETPQWAKGLILSADAYICTYYRKD